MTKIFSPNKQYCGISASVEFRDGVGETDNQYLIEWFKEQGYTVEERGQIKETKSKKSGE